MVQVMCGRHALRSTPAELSINESGTDAGQLPVNPPDLFKQDLIQWNEDASPVWKAELVEVMMTASKQGLDIGPVHYPGATKDSPH